MTELQYKLANFPPVFVVSVKNSVDRRKYINEEFVKYGINNVYYSIFDLWEEDKYIVTGKNLSQLHIGSYGPVTSHLLTNKYWIQNTDYEYVVIVEDDLSFEFVQYWNFTWSNFFNNLPENWGLVQLSTMREIPEEAKIEFRERHNCDLGCQAYLIKRNYANELISRYITKDGFNLDIPICDVLYKENEIWKNCNLIPIVENIIYESVGKTYCFPLFYEYLKFDTLSIGNDQKESWRKTCYDRFLKIWKKIDQK
jgi:hypothetical protein